MGQNNQTPFPLKGETIFPYIFRCNAVFYQFCFIPLLFQLRKRTCRRIFQRRLPSHNIIPYMILLSALSLYHFPQSFRTKAEHRHHTSHNSAAHFPDYNLHSNTHTRFYMYDMCRYQYFLYIRILFSDFYPSSPVSCTLSTVQ